MPNKEFGVPTPVPKSNVDSGLFPAAFGTVAIILLCYAACMFYFGFQSYGWVSTEGTITSSRFVQVDSVDNRHFELEVRYRYRVGKDVFENGDIRPQMNNQWIQIGIWTNVPSSYPENSPVTVYYDKHEPAHACLHPGVDQLGFSLVMIFAGLFASLPLTPIARKIQDKLFPTKPVLMTEMKDGHRIFTSSFREEQEKEEEERD